jgi:HSP20 family molecular chaperone IbpA
MTERFKESPEITSRLDAEQSKFVIEFSMLEVEKESIKLTMFEGGCSLSAHTDDSDYVSLVSFPCPVIPSETKAFFDEGYLIIEAPLKDGLQGAIEISIE